MNYKYILTAVLIVAVFSGTASAWLSGYDHRMAITVNNGGASELSYYQFNFTNDTNVLVAAGDMQASGADCRVTDSSDNLIPFWNETAFNATGTKIWANDTLPAGNTTFYLYYGNAAASSASNGTYTFELFDGFNDNTTIATSQTTKDTVYDSSRYAGFPIVIKLHDGTLFAVFTEADQHGTPFGTSDIKWINSTDNGVTWSVPQIVTAHPNATTSAAHPHALEFNDSGTWTILVHYIHQATSSGIMKCKKSTDGGANWGTEINISSTDNDRYLRGKAIEMSNDNLIFGSYAYDVGTGCQAQISSDGGDNWTEYNISTTSGLSELSLIEKTTNGHILAVIRNYVDYKKYSSTSTDYGQTWSAPVDMTLTASESPVDVIRLNDGNMLISWEKTDTDFRVAISEDEGATWNVESSFSVYYDVTMPANAGYVSSVETTNNQLYSLFYVQHATDHADIYGNDVDISTTKIWSRTGTPTLDYADSVLRIHGTDNSDHRLTSTKTFSAPHIMESRSKINWTGINNAQLGFGLFDYNPSLPGYVGSFATVKDRSSEDNLSQWLTTNGSGSAQYIDDVNMDAYFTNVIKWKSGEVKFIHTGGTLTNTNYTPVVALPVVIGGHAYLDGVYDMYLDWLFIRKYTATEPTATLGAAETQTGGAYNITLPLGWSIIGWTDSTDRTAHYIGGLIGGNCSYVTERNRTTGLYVNHNMAGPESENNFAIERGWGYFVSTTAETLWERDT